jgi:hypothetical protein
MEGDRIKIYIWDLISPEISPDDELPRDNCLRVLYKSKKDFDRFIENLRKCFETTDLDEIVFDGVIEIYMKVVPPNKPEDRDVVIFNLYTYFIFRRDGILKYDVIEYNEEDDRDTYVSEADFKHDRIEITDKYGVKHTYYFPRYLR